MFKIKINTEPVATIINTMSQDTIIRTHSKRATDLVSGSDTHSKPSICKGDAKLFGKRSTDGALATEFGETDKSKAISNDETYLKPNDLIISRSDVQGTITQCNSMLAALSAWSQEELLGSNHSLLRHPDMPQAIFKLLWDTIKAKKEFYGYIKNLNKDGGFYWFFAYITADLDDNGKIIGYTAYRRFAPRSTIEAIAPIYKILIKAEEQGGVEVSEALFKDYLIKTGFGSYDQLIVDIQLADAQT